MDGVYFCRRPDGELVFTFIPGEDYDILKQMTMDEHKAFIQNLNKSGYALSVDEDGNPIMIPSIHQYTNEERETERRLLHEATDNDYAKYARQVRCNIDVEYSQKVLNYIDQYNIAVSDTVNQSNYPQDVTYPEYVLP